LGSDLSSGGDFVSIARYLAYVENFRCIKAIVGFGVGASISPTSVGTKCSGQGLQEVYWVSGRTIGDIVDVPALIVDVEIKQFIGNK
jgi:hypothetical protein